MNRNKKAILGLSLTELLGVILVGLLIIFAVVPAVTRFLGIFTSTKHEDAKRNFDALTYEVQKLIGTPQKYAVSQDFPFYITNDLILVGYDSGRTSAHTDCSPDTEEASNKYCHNKPCLCLHENTWWDDFDDDSSSDEPIKCYEFNENIVFLAPSDNKKGVLSGAIKPFAVTYYENTNQYEDLFVYGDGCKEPELPASKLFIEKFYNNATRRIYIYIDLSTDQTRPILEARAQFLKNKYNESIDEKN